MPRTTDTAVRGIIEGVDEEDDLDPFIETANIVVTALCEQIYLLADSVNGPSQLELIERWLAAHFYSCDRSRLLTETIGKAKDGIEGKIDLGLQLTHHGQQVKGIDFRGALADFGQNRRKVKVTWLGRTAAERGIPRNNW